MVCITRNQIFARNDPFSHLRSHLFSFTVTDEKRLAEQKKHRMYRSDASQNQSGGVQAAGSETKRNNPIPQTNLPSREVPSNKRSPATGTVGGQAMYQRSVEHPGLWAQVDQQVVGAFGSHRPIKYSQLTPPLSPLILGATPTSTTV